MSAAQWVPARGPGQGWYGLEVGGLAGKSGLCWGGGNRRSTEDSSWDSILYPHQPCSGHRAAVGQAALSGTFQNVPLPELAAGLGRQFLSGVDVDWPSAAMHVPSFSPAFHSVMGK